MRRIGPLLLLLLVVGCKSPTAPTTPEPPQTLEDCTYVVVVVNGVPTLQPKKGKC